MALAPVLFVTIDGGAIRSGVVTQSTGGDPIASSYNGFFAFGDSDIDSGYYLTHPIHSDLTTEALYQDAVADGGGLPTTIGSPMNSVLLAAGYRPDRNPGGRARRHQLCRKRRHYHWIAERLVGAEHR